MDKIAFPALENNGANVPKDMTGNGDSPEALSGVGEILWKV